MIQEPLKVMPFDIQRDWQAQVHPAEPTEAGAVRLIGAEPAPEAYEAQRITVFLLDEDGFPLHNWPVAFSFSTAGLLYIPPQFQWIPPQPYRAQVIPTRFGACDQIQGSAVKDGPGGVTVYVFHPDYSSDVVEGCGMLADHTGLKLTFQLQRAGVVSMADRIAELKTAFDSLSDRIEVLAQKTESLDAGFSTLANL